MIRLMADASSPSTKSLSAAVPSAARKSSGSRPQPGRVGRGVADRDIRRCGFATEPVRVGGGLRHAEIGRCGPSTEPPGVDRHAVRRQELVGPSTSSVAASITVPIASRWRNAAICPRVTGSSGQKSDPLRSHPW